MKKVFLVLGGMICSLIIFAVPVLTTLSWVLGWDALGKMLLHIALVFEVIMLGLIISWKVDDDG